MLVELPLVELFKVARENIHLEIVDGLFLVDMEDRDHEPVQISDISIAGAGIRLSVPLTIGANVDLTLVTGDWKLGVPSEVVWCCQAKPDRHAMSWGKRYRAGLKFDSHNSEYNINFFMAARSIINHIDNSSRLEKRPL